MRAFLISSALVMSACSTTAPAPVAAAAKPAATQAAASDPNRQICKRITVTGSNYPKKFCSTQAEWDAQEKASLEQSEQIDAARRAADTSTVGRPR